MNKKKEFIDWVITISLAVLALFITYQVLRIIDARYATSSIDTVTVNIIAQMGNISMYRVGSNNDVSTAPPGTNAQVDALPAQSANPASFTSLIAGSHTAYSTDIAGYDEIAGSCTYDIGSSECNVASFPFAPVCDGANCGLSIDVEYNKVKKILFKYIVTPPPGAPPPAQCEDGEDNDNDQKYDHVDSPLRAGRPADPGCSSITDNDERDLRFREI